MNVDINLDKTEESNLTNYAARENKTIEDKVTEIIKLYLWKAAAIYGGGGTVRRD